MKSDNLDIGRFLHLKSEIKLSQIGRTVTCPGFTYIKRADNFFMESFFKTLKVERIHRTRYESRAQAKLDIVERTVQFELSDF